jgi:hypothetical protein
MDSQRRQESQWWPERQGAGLSQKARDEFETSPAGRRQQARLLLRKDDWSQKEVDEREDGERPEFPYKQEPSGLELLR